jgi:hypothetical protein
MRYAVLMIRVDYLASSSDFAREPIPPGRWGISRTSQEANDGVLGEDFATPHPRFEQVSLVS